MGQSTDDRDLALAALMGRIQRAADEGVAVLFDPDALAEAAALAEIVGRGPDLEAFHRLGMFHWYRFLSLPKSEDREDFETAVRYLLPVYQEVPEAVPDQLKPIFADTLAVPDAVYVAEHAEALLRSYQSTGDLAELVESVLVFREVVQADSVDDPDRVRHLSGLGVALMSLTLHLGDVETVAEAVETFRQVVAALPCDDPERATALTSLSGALRTMCERTDDDARLAEATEIGREAVSATGADDPRLSIRLSLLSSLLRMRAERGGGVDSLLEAVDLGRQAVTAASAGGPEWTAASSTVSAALQVLFRHTGETELLQEAVEFGRGAVAAAVADDPDHVGHLNNLGGALEALFERTGEVQLLTEAVDCLRGTVAATPAGSGNRAAYLNNLGILLRMASGRTGELAPLLEAVEFGRQAVAGASVDHPGRADFLGALCISLSALADREGDAARLDEAVEFGRQAVAATSADGLGHADALSNLSIVLSALFERTGDTRPLVEAVEAGREAVLAHPVGHPGRARCLNNLGASLRALSEQTGEVAVMTEAVDVGRQAVVALPEDHADRGRALTNVAAALMRLYERAGDGGVLAEAVDFGRRAVDATAADHPDRGPALGNLGGMLQRLHEHTGDVGALVEAVDAGRESVRATPEGHADRGARLSTLGIGLQALADKSQNSELLLESADCFRAASQVAGATALSRIQALRGFAAVAGAVSAYADEALAAMETAIALLPQISPRTLARADREYRVGRLRSLPEIAASAALDVGDPRRAVELLEATRGILVADMLGGSADSPASVGVEVLSGHADPGPIVYLLAGPQRCDALILTGSVEEPVRVVRLPGLTRDEADARADRLLTAHLAASRRGYRDMERESADGDDRDVLDILGWLWDVVAEPVLAALGCTATPSEDQVWPRIWWCPVGVMAYLPIHAAGHHEDVVAAVGAGHGRRAALDRVVSSYTPTVRALAFARAQPPTGKTATLIIAVPDAPGTSRLKGVAEEADAIVGLIPQALRLEHPVREEVLAALPSHPVAHFACHGLADWSDPAASRLILHDYQTQPLTVADIGSLHLTGELAYLSACETMSANLRLTDEALHLTGAFHLAGYQGVIGTLWRVSDDAAQRISQAFYAYLTKDGSAPPDAGLAARGLHHAVRALRAESPDRPTLWMAHTHTGV